MMNLLVFKERLKAFYGKYSMYITPVLKFVFAMIGFTTLNVNIGFMTKLKSPVIPIALSLICCFLPTGFITGFLAVFMLLHLSSLSLELTVIAGIFVLIVAVLYGGLQPGDSMLIALTPIMFYLKVPYAVPLIVGLAFGVFSVIPVCCGVFIYYLLVYVKQNAGVLAGNASIDITQKYMQLIKSLFSNQMMILMIFAFAVTIILVFLIKNLSFDYSWTIAIAAGTIVQLVVIFMGDMRLDITLSLSSIVISMLGSVVLAFLYHFFVFTVDYSRTEFMQFDDDDYHYYVKAVPKIAVTAPDVKVKKINKRNEF